MNGGPTPIPSIQVDAEESRVVGSCYCTYVEGELQRHNNLWTCLSRLPPENDRDPPPPPPPRLSNYEEFARSHGARLIVNGVEQHKEHVLHFVLICIDTTEYTDPASVESAASPWSSLNDLRAFAIKFFTSPRSPSSSLRQSLFLLLVGDDHRVLFLFCLLSWWCSVRIINVGNNYKIPRISLLPLLLSSRIPESAVKSNSKDSEALRAQMPNWNCSAKLQTNRKTKEEDWEPPQIISSSLTALIDRKLKLHRV